MSCTMLVTTCLLLSFLLTAQASGQTSPIRWAVEFDDPSALANARLTTETRGGTRVLDVAVADVRVEEGVLYLGGRFGPDSAPGDYVCLTWGEGWQVPDLLPIEPIDITRFPVLEVRWRMEKRFGPYATAPQFNLMWHCRLADGRDSIAYTTGPYAQAGSWLTATVRFAPDSSVPGPLTPRVVTGIRLETGARMCHEPAWIEVDYIRIRAFNDAEQRAEQQRVQLLSDYTPPPIPPRLRDLFLYGCYGRPAFAGGLEGAFDQMTRHHMNCAFGVGGDSKAMNAAAAPLGMYIVASPGGGLTQKVETDGPDAVAPEIDRIAAAAAGCDRIVGWYIRDEPLVIDLWGVVAVKRMLEQRDPERLPLFIVHSADIIAYYERFATIAWTDRYPFCTGQRDPWSVGPWCRQISQLSKCRQWFTPQAFGDSDDWRAKPGFDFYLPTVEQFRLMMHLALANGAKAFATFINHVSLAASLSDRVGNPTPLMVEASRLGERWAPIAPLMLDARPVTDHAVATTAGGRGISVGAMAAPGAGPVFLVATNEELTATQGGTARLPEAWVASERAVYDLEALQRIAPPGAAHFEVAALVPGGGRIHVLATAAQYAALRDAIRSNRIEQRLRVQGADRVIAQRWDLPLGDYDAAVARTRDLLARQEHDQADAACDLAAGQLARTCDGDADLVATRAALDAARTELGELDGRIHLGSEQVRPGREAMAQPFMALCKRYDDVRGRYVRGERAGVAEEAGRLRADVAELGTR